MSYWSDQQLKMTEGGMDLSSVKNKNVCASCFDDDALQAYVRSEAKVDRCDYCDAVSEQPIAASVADLIGYLLACIEQEWVDAEGALPRDDETGDWMLDTPVDTEELVFHHLDLNLPQDTSGALQSDILGALPSRSWCHIDPLRTPPHEAIAESWKLFCYVIKHERRFFFRNYSSAQLDKDFESYEAEYSISELLEKFADYCSRAGLFVTRPAGTMYIRCRSNNGGKKLYARDVGPPPLRFATQSNRMSPSGIPMFYGAEMAKTALAETADKSGDFAVGTFLILRDVTLLDLREPPKVPSLFDINRAPDRRWARFMRDFVDDFQRPIARDDRAHIEYVPTQVVTEYFRTVVHVEGKRLDGILYSSTKQSGGVAVVIFADTFDVKDDGPEDDFKKVRLAFEREDHDEPWLEMVKCENVSWRAP